MTQTFNETHFDFNEEAERLQERIDELEERQSELDPDAPQRDAIGATIQKLESQRKGVIWARDQAYESEDFPQWGEDVDGVTLGGLRAGVYGGLRDDLENDSDAGSGTSSNMLVAEGTVEAPYTDGGMTDAERTGAVSQLHPFYLKWAEARINALMDPESSIATEGEGNGTSSDDSQKAT